MPDDTPPSRTEPSPTERLRARAALVLDRLPASVRVRLGGGAPTVVDGQTLDPTLQAILALEPRGDRGALLRETPLRARARTRREALAARPAPTSVATVRNLTVDGAEGPLSARLYTTPGGGRPPLLVYFHGGGYTVCDLDTHDEPCRLLCREARQVVLSVDYRLAPEHRFPAAHDDALAAFRWAQANALSLGADPERVLVGGDSAGGTLAAATAQAAHDDAPPVAQLLIYPAVDTPTDRPSRTLFDGFFLQDAERAAYFETYTRGTGTAPDNPRLSPIYGPLAGLAPALVLTAGFDVLRDEGIAYADALRDAGTPALVLHEPALPHAFINMTGVSGRAKRAVRDLAGSWHRFVATHAGAYR